MNDETPIPQLLILLEDAKNALINSGYAETHILIQDIAKALNKQKENSILLAITA